MASSSSFSQERSIVTPKQYDAFISYRGPDVKETLAKQLCKVLQEKGCRAFLDREEIEGGDCLPSAIHNAICSSVVQIAIFSKGYAQSKWCLDELVLMLEQQPNSLFIPVFYDVQPWKLRHIENDNSEYAAAFYEYQRKGTNFDKFDEWKKALASAADISGYERSQHRDNLCERIVSRVLGEKEKRSPLPVAEYPVGLAELVQDFRDLWTSKAARDKVTIVGIFGLGGSGKTTLAKELYNNKRSSYHASCFLSDVRKSFAQGDLHSLQSKLFKDLFHEDRKFGDTVEGTEQLEHRLGRARDLRFLIVLDDIDHLDRLDTLLPEPMLGSGSLVIITTRDQSVLRGADICYRMKGMNWDDAKDLFCSHAFRGQDIPTTFEKLVEGFVDFCGGLPLSLKVLGDHVYGQNEDDWELELEKVKNTQPMDIMQSLKISFDDLDNEEKQIFIDITCFFNKDLRYIVKDVAMSIWNVSGWSAEHAIQTLQDKCLVELGKDDEFQMHNLLRDLGRQLADPPRLWKSEVLRSMEAMGFKQILEETKCRCFHSFKDSFLETKISYLIDSSKDSVGTELLWLEFCNKEGILKSIPYWIPLQKLRFLSVSNIEELWTSFQQQMQTNNQASFDLRVLLISGSPLLQNLPDLIGKCNHLEELHIAESLERTDITSLLESLQQLTNLNLLRLYGCGISLSGILNLSRGKDSPNFEAFRSRGMDMLETIEFGRLDNISKLVITADMCPRLGSLEVKCMENLKEMQLEHLERLNTLTVYKCPKLETISGLSSAPGVQISYERTKSLASLGSIDIGECRQLQSIGGLEELQGLESLVIKVPEYGDSSLWNCICGLKRLPTEYTFLVGKAVPKTMNNLNINLFSEVVDNQTVAEVKRGEYVMEMKGSSSANTIYAFLISPLMNIKLTHKSHTTVHVFEKRGEWMITGLLAAGDSIVSLSGVKIEKGFMVTINKSEEGKTLNLLQRIIDRLYIESKPRKLGAYRARRGEEEPKPKCTDCKKDEPKGKRGRSVGSKNFKVGAEFVTTSNRGNRRKAAKSIATSRQGH